MTTEFFVTSEAIRQSFSRVMKSRVKIIAESPRSWVTKPSQERKPQGILRGGVHSMDQDVGNRHYDDVRHNDHAGVSNHQPHGCLTLFNQSFIQALIKENIKAPRHWPLCGKFTGDRWISRTNGQLRGKCFHFMTSSCWFRCYCGGGLLTAITLCVSSTLINSTSAGPGIFRDK